MALDLDVVVDTDLGALPERVFVGGWRQRLHRRAIEHLECPAPVAWQALEGTLVEIDHERGDRGVELLEAEEAPVTQPRQHPAGDQENSLFYFRFVPGTERACWDDDAAIMPCELLVRALQDRLVAIGFGDADLGVIGDEDRRRAPRGRQRPDVRSQPVRERLRAGRFRVGVVARTPDRHEHRRPEHRLIVRAVDRDLGAGIVDEQLLAGDVPLAHRARRLALPAPVMGAELAVAVRRGSVLSPIFLPQQLQRDVSMALELLVHRRARRHHELRRPACRLAIHAPLELGVVPLFRDRPCDPGCPCRVQILRHCACRQPGTGCHLAHRQPRGRQPQYLPDPVHGDPLARHSPSSRQKAGGVGSPKRSSPAPAADLRDREHRLRDREHRLRNDPKTVHDHAHSVFTLARNRCSRSSVNPVHDRAAPAVVRVVVSAAVNAAAP